MKPPGPYDNNLRRKEHLDLARLDDFNPACETEILLSL
jgi:hypothetical protein